MQVQSLGWEDPGRGITATCSNILAWKVSWIKEPGTLIGHEVTRSPAWLHAHTQFPSAWCVLCWCAGTVVLLGGLPLAQLPTGGSTTFSMLPRLPWRAMFVLSHVARGSAVQPSWSHSAGLIFPILCRLCLTSQFRFFQEFFSRCQLCLSQPFLEKKTFYYLRFIWSKEN